MSGPNDADFGKSARALWAELGPKERALLEEGRKADATTPAPAVAPAPQPLPTIVPAMLDTAIQTRKDVQTATSLPKGKPNIFKPD